MKLPLRTTLSRRDPAKRSVLRRVLRGTLYVKLGLIVFVVAADGPSPVSGAVESLLGLIVGPGSVLSSLDQAQLTNARLVFIDADGRERARFQRVDATFDWA